MEAVLDFSRPLDVRLLDQVVTVFYDAANPQASGKLRPRGARGAAGCGRGSSWARQRHPRRRTRCGSNHTKAAGAVVARAAARKRRGTARQFNRSTLRAARPTG